MSKIFNKNKNKFPYELDRIKNNSQIKNIHKNILNKSSNYCNNYLFSSPYKAITKNKKNIYISIRQKNYKTNNNNNHRRINYANNNNSIKKLTYNKSFELNLNNNKIIGENPFNLKNGNLYFNYNNNYKHNNKSVILNKNTKKLKNKIINKSEARNSNSPHKIKNIKNANDNMVKKLDEKFKSLESNIIDEKYEKDIDHDEMIISTDKYQNNTSTKRKKKQINNYIKKLANIIDSNTKKKEKDNLLSNSVSYLNIFENKNNVEFDENYLLNTSFEEKRSDFNIMYSNNYENDVLDDLLSLEIILIIENVR